MSRPDLISIILPVYNQADHIESVVREYDQALAKVPRAREFLLVVNNCRDQSLQVCEALAKELQTV